MPRETSNELIFVDLEMSGLDPDRERILEIAVAVTDSNLNMLAEGPELVLHQDQTILAAMDPWNQKQHAQSGLIAEVRKSEIDEKKADRALISFLEPHCAAGTCCLAGNSIHQDRRFMRRYLPRLDEFLHYRIVDVSSIKEVIRRWYPKIYEQRPRKKGTHRARADIREAIEELAYYRKHAFIKPSQ